MQGIDYSGLIWYDIMQRFGITGGNNGNFKNCRTNKEII